MTLETTEREIQEWAADYLDMRGVLYCHVPNEQMVLSYLDDDEAFGVLETLKAQGMQRGCPDLLIFDPPPDHPEYIGAALELKSEAGQLKDRQEEWLDDLEERGWFAGCVRGMENTQKLLESLGY